MKRVTTYLIIILTIFSIITVKANAQVIKSERKFDNNTALNLVEKGTGGTDCGGILTPDAADMIKELLGYIRIAAPILLLILTAIDFATAVFQEDNDALKKATSKVTKRAIAAACLFFIPTVIRAIFDIKGVRDAIVIPKDPLCGTMVSVPDTNQFKVG